MNLKRIITRSLYYFRVGYSNYLSLPTTILGYCSVIYYLAIQNLPSLEMFFPKFHVFLAVFVCVGFPVSVLLGWLHFKRMLSPFFKAELDIGVEANPYATKITAPVNLPLYKIISQLGKQHGIDTTELDAIIERTEKKFAKIFHV